MVARGPTEIDAAAPKAGTGVESRRWLAHGLGALNLVLFGTAVVLLVATIALPWHGWGVRGGTLLVQGALAVMGWLLAVRLPRHPIGWLLLVGVTALSINTLEVYSHLVAVDRGWTATGVGPALWEALWVPGIVLILYAFAVFPDGRRPAGWRGTALLVLAPLTAVSVTVAAAVEGAVLGGPTTPVDAVGVLFLPMPLFTLVVIWTILARFRDASGVRRQQLRWVVYTAVPYALTLTQLPLLDASGGTLFTVNAILSTTLLTLMIIAMGLAVLRYRLYDLDRIVSRTVTYALLTGVVAVVWASVALVPTAVIGGGEVGNTTVAVATLAAVAAVNPLRRRLQDAVDQRLHRERYDARREVELLGTRLSEEVDPATVVRHIETTVGRTLAPTTVAVWTADDGGRP